MVFILSALCQIRVRGLLKLPGGREWLGELSLVLMGGAMLSSVQFSSDAQSCPTLCDSMDCTTPDLLVNHQLPEFTLTPVHWSMMPSNHLILCCLLLLLPSIFPNIRVFSKESALRIRWPKYWNFSFSISPSNEHSGLISFRMDWLDLLAVQRTFKSLLQHHSSKASVLWCSAFFVGPGSVNLESTFLLMGRAVFPPCCLTWDQTMVEIMKRMATSLKRSCACTDALSALTLQQATTKPGLQQRLLDTHRKVWVSLLGGEIAEKRREV